MGLPQIIITKQMVLAEFIKIGVSQEIDDDLSYRCYTNQLTYKDIKHLKRKLWS